MSPRREMRWQCAAGEEPPLPDGVTPFRIDVPEAALRDLRE
jgi:hypothetical protein